MELELELEVEVELELELDMAGVHTPALHVPSVHGVPSALGGGATQAPVCGSHAPLFSHSVLALQSTGVPGVH